jgi:hypothetical protein
MELDVPGKPEVSPAFTIIRVRTNGPRQDGSETKNKYSIDVEVVWGIFPVTMRHNRRFHLSQPLTLHPAHKAILKQATDLVGDLENQGLIGQEEGPAVLEIQAPTEGADERTKATRAALFKQANGGT